MKHLKRTDDEYVLYYNRFKDVAEKFKSYLEVFAKPSIGKKTTGMPSSYSRYLMRLFYLYETEFNDCIINPISLDTYNKINKIRELDEYKEFNRKYNRFYNAVFNYFFDFVKQQKLSLEDRQEFTVIGDTLYQGELYDLNEDDYKDIDYLNEIIQNKGKDTNLIVRKQTTIVNTTKEKSFNHHKKNKNKINYNTINENKSRLGLAGEYLALNYENKRLEKNGLKLKAEHSSRLTNDGASYDIKSYDEDGNEIFIEVKTTKSKIDTPFYMSNKEYQFAIHYKKQYQIYRIYDFNPKKGYGKLYIFQNPFDDNLDATPSTFEITFKDMQIKSK